MSDDTRPCGCRVGSDGYVQFACALHEPQWDEWSIRRLLDAELDAQVRELAGRSPTRIERKVGAVGDFAISRKR